MSSLVTHQIDKRLGPLDSGLRDRITGLDLEQLERLGDALLDFEKVEQLTDWLARA